MAEKRNWKRPLWRICKRGVLPLLALWLILGWAAASVTTLSEYADVGVRTHIGMHPIRPVWVQAQDGVPISAWYGENSTDRAVILLAGIYGNRRHMVRRAEWYLDRGYSVMLPDLRGTGQSGDAKVTIGWRERFDLLACERFLRDRGYTHIGAHGISLGAATIAYSLVEDPDWSWMVLESSYSSLDSAWRNRLAMVGVPHAITQPVRWFAQWQIGARVDTLAPLRYMPKATAPALILAGDSEPELKSEETQAMFDACGSAIKRLHFFAGARHENFLSRYEDEFWGVLDPFMDEVEALQTPPASTLAAAHP